MIMEAIWHELLWNKGIKIVKSSDTGKSTFLITENR